MSNNILAIDFEIENIASKEQLKTLTANRTAIKSGEYDNSGYFAIKENIKEGRITSKLYQRGKYNALVSYPKDTIKTDIDAVLIELENILSPAQLLFLNDLKKKHINIKENSTKIGKVKHLA